MRTALLSVACLVGFVAFLAPASPLRAAEAITVEVSPAKVGRYDKVEMTIRRPDGPGKYHNPFDPDEVDVWLEITTPGGRRLALPAFWYQDYQRRTVERGNRKIDWLYPVGPPGWKARFAPMEVGPYSAIARLKDRRHTARSEPVRFQATASSSPGFVRRSRRDPRFLELDDGRPFFALGQNLAFIGPTQFATLGKAEEILGKLSANGANFLRVWTCCQDWALAVEARKSAWGRSWAWKPPLVRMPGKEDDPSAPRCVKVGDRPGASVALSTPNPLAVRPETRYLLAGRVRTEGRAAVRISAGSATLGSEKGDKSNLPRSGPEGASHKLDLSPFSPRSAPGKDWTPFEQPLTTGAGQLFIDRITFGQEGAGAAWLDALSLREAAGGPELLWEAAVNRPIRGFYNPTDCFILDQLVEAARRQGIYLQLCVINRDLYMKALKPPDKGEAYEQAIRQARKLLRYAVARWGYATSVAAWEYFNENDPGLPTDRFYDELGGHLERIDPYRHLRVTSAWGPAPKDWRHPRLDMAQLHHYLRPADKERGHDAVAAVLQRTALVRRHAPDKPVLLAEFGLAEDNWQRSRFMKEDKELVHFHNSLWASAMSGACGTTMFWWWELLDPMGAYPQYRPLAEFVRDIPFTTANLKPTTATTAAAGDALRVLGLQSKDAAYLWLSDPQATWWNLVVEKQAPAEVRGATLEVRGLAPGDYRVLWWDTREGKPARQEKAAAPQGTLRLGVPAFSRDIACKITR